MKPGDQRGFLHKKIIGLAGKALGIGSSFIPGPIGGVVRAVTGGGQGGRGARFQSVGAPLPTGSRVQFPTPGIVGAVQRFLPGGGTGFTTLPGAVGPGGILGAFGARGGVTGAGFERGAAGVNGACPAPVLGGSRRINQFGQQACPGFHWNQSTYTRLGGPCSSKPAGLVEKGTEQVKNRRKFNTANGPARNRAIARLKAGEGDAKAALKALGYRTISKQSSREMRMRRRGHR